MVDRDRASVLAHRAAQGIPRTQQAATAAVPEPDSKSVRISARINSTGRNALRRLAATHGLSVAALIDLIATAARDQDSSLEEIVASRADVHRRLWGGRR